MLGKPQGLFRKRKDKNWKYELVSLELFQFLLWLQEAGVWRKIFIEAYKIILLTPQWNIRLINAGDLIPYVQ